MMPHPLESGRRTTAFSIFASWSCPLQGEVRGDEDVVGRDIKVSGSRSHAPRSLPLGRDAQGKLLMNFALLGCGIDWLHRGAQLCWPLLVPYYCSPQGLHSASIVILPESVAQLMIWTAGNIPCEEELMGKNNLVWHLYI